MLSAKNAGLSALDCRLACQLSVPERTWLVGSQRTLATKISRHSRSDEPVALSEFLKSSGRRHG
jgi:hypothetical protein